MQKRRNTGRKRALSRWTGLSPSLRSASTGWFRSASCVRWASSRARRAAGWREGASTDCIGECSQSGAGTLGNACLLARGAGRAPRKPRDAKALAAYARQSLPRALATAGALQQGEAPPASRDAVRRLQAEYAKLLQRALSAKRSSATVLLPAVQSAMRSVDSRARAAGVPPCGIQ